MDLVTLMPDPNTSEFVILLNTGSVAQLKSESSTVSSRVVSFVGGTHSGKSFLIRLLQARYSKNEYHVDVVVLFKDPQLASKEAA